MERYLNSLHSLDFCDLHIHTTASDGQYSTGEIIKMSKELNLTTIAITDHDTIAGVKDLEKFDIYNINIIKGIEIGALEGDCYHVLGYNIEDKDESLNKLCETLVQNRNTRKHRIIKYLNDLGVDITIEEVEHVAGGNVIARPHFAQILQKKGYVVSREEAFTKYLACEAFKKIERIKPAIHECISVIKNAKGLAFLAHPITLNLKNEELEAYIKELIGYGLDGIECYYPLHTKEYRGYLIGLAKKYNLLISGGSDFHGEKGVLGLKE